MRSGVLFRGLFHTAKIYPGLHAGKQESRYSSLFTTGWGPTSLKAPIIELIKDENRLRILHHPYVSVLRTYKHLLLAPNHCL